MIRLLITALAVILGDQVAKAAIRGHFAPGGEQIVIPGLLSWTYVQNTHGAFGMFGEHPMLLAALSLPIVAFFLLSFRHLVADSIPAQLALGGILGGAAGNMWDRVHAGFVTDFIDVKLWTETFNVADSAITLGAAGLILITLARRRRTEAT